MRRAALGTIVVHGLVAIALVAIGRTDDVQAPSERPIELVDVSPVDTQAPPPSAATSGGGSPGSSTPKIAPRPVEHVVRRRVIRAAPSPASAERVGDLLGPGTIDRDVDVGGGGDGGASGEGGDGNGRGHGHGSGIGDGIGLGTPTRVDAPLPAPPPPPKLSKARPPRLIFPSRGRDLDPDSHPFVAAIVVDENGYVDGAHLVHGYGGPRDALAASAIFRFRYEPALDDDGVPIRAHVEQTFLVE